MKRLSRFALLAVIGLLALPAHAADPILCDNPGAGKTKCPVPLSLANIPTLDAGHLPSAGPGAGPITYPASITLDAQGRVAAATSGSAPAALASTTPANVGTAAVGVGTTSARSDHVHALPATGTAGTYANPSSVTTDAQGRVTAVAAGSAPVALSSSAPADVGTSAAVGVGATAARSDHVHKLPNAGPGAGTYANIASLTIDAQGRVTAVVSGPPDPAFGNGSDGAIVLDGTATFSFASKSGSTYTLNRYIYPTTLQINAGVTLITYRDLFDTTATADMVTNFGVIRARTSINVDGTIDASGHNASGGNAGSIGSFDAAFWGGYGGRGGSTGALAGVGFDAKGLLSRGGSGGAGAGGAGGVGGNTALSAFDQYKFVGIGTQGNDFALLLGGQLHQAPYDDSAFTPAAGVPPGSFWPVNGGGGGGAGSRTGAATFGAGGEGGWPLVLCAPSITVAGAGAIKSRGGNGGNATGTAPDTATGGGAGGGGYVSIYANSYSGTAPDVSAGTPGTGFNGGASGGAGSAGQVTYLTNTQ